VLPRPRVALRIRARVSLQSAARCKALRFEVHHKRFGGMGFSRITDGSANRIWSQGYRIHTNRKGKLDMKTLPEADCSRCRTRQRSLLFLRPLCTAGCTCAGFRCEGGPRSSIRTGRVAKVCSGESLSSASVTVDFRQSYPALRRIPARLAKGKKEAAVGVFKRKRKYWIDYYDSQRNRIQESSHSSSKRDAEDLLALRKSEILRARLDAP